MRRKEFTPRGREEWVGLGRASMGVGYYTFNVRLDFMDMHFYQGRVNHTGVCAAERRERYEI